MFNDDNEFAYEERRSKGAKDGTSHLAVNFVIPRNWGWLVALFALPDISILYWCPF
jgi:hypothetical protein